MKREKVKKCKKCGSEHINKNDNFCGNCGEKLQEVCECQYMKGKYNCGENTCPSYRVLLIAKERSKTK